MDSNLIRLINDIKSSNLSVIYSSFRNLFQFINIPLCTFEIIEGKKILFRVRSHTETDPDFFENINDLSYRQDITSIRNFGRCNEPFQSRFYASDDDAIAFSEVAEIARTENKKNTAYHTTSVWKFNQSVLASLIVEPDNMKLENYYLKEITKKCFEFIETNNFTLQKDDLIALLKGIANEFTKPSSMDKDAFLFSAAYTNYLFDARGTQNKKIEGIVYPTCLNNPTTKNLGLNYVFNTNIIGFDNKIEFVNAYRSRLDKFDKTYKEVEIIKMKSVNKLTGQIDW